MLVKAVVWRESRFDPQKLGGAGERGLMQVSEIAVQDWALENKVENFRVEELFDRKTNLDAGAWYLHRATQHWQRRPTRPRSSSPSTTLARAARQRWAGGDGAPISARAFQKNIDFPGTKKQWSRSSIATTSINGADECSCAMRKDYFEARLGPMVDRRRALASEMFTFSRAKQ